MVLNVLLFWYMYVLLVFLFVVCFDVLVFRFSLERENMQFGRWGDEKDLAGVGSC